MIILDLKYCTVHDCRDYNHMLIVGTFSFLMDGNKISICCNEFFVCLVPEVFDEVASITSLSHSTRSLTSV